MRQQDIRSTSLYNRFLKRFIDVSFALVILLILLIPFLFIALAIKADSRGPIIFKQNRVGRNSKVFQIYKFRTMDVETPHLMPTRKFQNAQQHITRVGAFLRKTSIDELPQLINILKGDMSLVGPRPLIQSESYINDQRHNLGIDLLLPGITGLAQVNGRDLVDPNQKIKWDLKYARSVCFALDCSIVAQTIFKVIIAKDIKEGQS